MEGLNSFIEVINGKLGANQDPIKISTYQDVIDNFGGPRLPTDRNGEEIPEARVIADIVQRTIYLNESAYKVNDTPTNQVIVDILSCVLAMPTGTRKFQSEPQMFIHFILEWLRSEWKERIPLSLLI